MRFRPPRPARRFSGRPRPTMWRPTSPRAAARHPPCFRASTTAELTFREEDVLDLMVAGLTNAAISQRLGLSAKTVRNYVSNVMAKVAASNPRGRDRPARSARAPGRHPH